MKKILGKKLFIISVFGFLAGISIFLIVLIIQELQPMQEAVTRKPLSTISPTPQSETGIPIKDNTVSFTRDNQHVYLQYKHVIYTEDSSTEDPVKVSLLDSDKKTWIGITEGPELYDQVAFDEIFSFKTIPGTKNFLFTMRWDRNLVAKGSGGQEIKTFYYDAGAQPALQSILDNVA